MANRRSDLRTKGPASRRIRCAVDACDSVATRRFSTGFCHWIGGSSQTGTSRRTRLLYSGAQETLSLKTRRTNGTEFPYISGSVHAPDDDNPDRNSGGEGANPSSFHSP